MIDLNSLRQAVADLNEEEVKKAIEQFVAGNPTPEEAQQVVTACQQGMSTVGDLFESGEYFVSDLLFAGDLLTEAMELLKPVMGNAGSAKRGKIVLGTVKGDLHDIGKNIFKNMAEAAGFEVFDLGIDQKPEAFVAKVREVQPQIVGMSALLTSALESMKDTVTALTEAGLRDDVKIIIGGNPVTEEACHHIGADAYTTSAAEGVKICRIWIEA